MPAPVPPELKEAVKAHVIQHGVRPTAAHFGIPVGTIGYWSAQEGWCKPVTEQSLPATMVPKLPNGSNTPSVAAQNALLGYSGKTKLKLAKSAHKGAATLARQPGEAIIAQAQQLKALTDTADKLHGWSKLDQQQPLVNITIGNAAQAPVIDVTDI